MMNTSEKVSGQTAFKKSGISTVLKPRFRINLAIDKMLIDKM